MASKRSIRAVSECVKRARKVMTLEQKVKVLDRLARGERASAVGRLLGVNESTIRTIKKNDAAIRASVACGTAKSSKASYMPRDHTLEKMEQALNVWIGDQVEEKVPLSTALIREKARRLVVETSKRGPSGEDVKFQASKGWFENFKRRHNVKLVGETTPSPANMKMRPRRITDMMPQQSSNPPPPPPQQQQQPKMVPAPVLKKILPAAPQLPVKVAPKPPPPRPVSPPMPPAPPPEVCLRWNSYHTNMQATFPSLLNNEQFVDVTLACEGRSIKCHKMILSACSSYFEDLLSQNPCQHPIVLMKDLRFWEVQALVDFMYRGEVNVGQDKLPSLLAAAEALQIKGLAGPASTSSSHDEDSLPPPLPLATDDFLDEPVPSPSSARRARKRRTTHQSPVLPLLRPQLSKPHLRPVSLPSTSSGYQEDLGSTSAEPPARRQRKFGPQIVDHKIKTEPVDIDLSNDSVDANDDGYMNKAYETGGGDSSGLGDDSADEHPSNTDNKDILQEQQLDTEQQHLDYGNNNGMPPPASNEGGLGYPHQAAPPYPELIMPAQDHDMAESIHGPV